MKKFKTVAGFLKEKNGLKYFQAPEAPVIDWHKAEVGAYYYLCDPSHNSQDGKAIYSISSFIVTCLCYTRLKGHVYGLMLSALFPDGRQELIPIMDDLVVYCYCVLWPATKAEVAKHKRIARRNIKAEITKKLEVVDEF